MLVGAGSEPVVIPDGEIHLWWASVSGVAAHRSWLSGLLDADERHRADRFLVAEARARFVTGRGLLRAVLESYTGIAAEHLRFAYGEHGKPRLAEANQPSFNASHSYDLVAVAVVGRGDLGVDVEKLRPVANAGAIAKRFFSPAEHDWLADQPGAARSPAFLHIWTCKEAFIKAVGSGVAVAVRETEVQPDPARLPRLLEAPAPENPADWSLMRVDPCPGYLGRVAARGEGWRVAVREFSFGEG